MYESAYRAGKGCPKPIYHPHGHLNIDHILPLKLFNLKYFYTILRVNKKALRLFFPTNAMYIHIMNEE